ncbi:MAG: type I site-specific restriction endonuclease, partial [Lentimonas sp.]
MSDFQPEQQARQQIDQQFNAADYMLFADGKAIGIIEAKKEGITLSAVHTQAAEY